MTALENGFDRQRSSDTDRNAGGSDQKTISACVGAGGNPLLSTVLRVPTDSNRRLWLRFVLRHWAIVLLILVLLLLYASVIVGLVQDWYKDGNNAHGFFVPVVSVSLAWHKRDVLKSLPNKPCPAGLLVILGSVGLLFLGSLGAELFLTRVSLVGNIAGLVLYFAGWDVLRAVTFPIGFLLLMIPLPGIIYYQLMFPLQLLASRLVMFALDWLNYFPVVREGNLLILPHYTLEVVEACSGVRSLVSLLALALGYGYIAGANRVTRAIMALAVVPLAILSNAFRVMLEAFVVNYYGVHLAEGRWHEVTGLVTFTSAAFLLLIGERLSRTFTTTSRMVAFTGEGQSLS